jgi:hypothetical protein
MQKSNKKIKISKVFFLLSFLPYALLLLQALLSAIFGFTFIFSTSYGIKAFFDSLLIVGWHFIVVIPILPICFIYQIIYLILINKRNSNKQTL